MAGFPIGRSTDQSRIGGSPWLIAAIHVLHRQQAPRHPPLALYNLEKYARARYGILKGRRARERAGRSLKTKQGDLGGILGCASCDTSFDLVLRIVLIDKALLRKEVIQPHLPVRLPCYDFTPITDPTFDGSLQILVGPPASGVADFRGVTGGVYKARERIHPDVADSGLLATPTSRSRVADCDPN